MDDLDPRRVSSTKTGLQLDDLGSGHGTLGNIACDGGLGFFQPVCLPVPGDGLSGSSSLMSDEPEWTLRSNVGWA